MNTASLGYELTLAGLAVGSAAALTGVGLIVTYRATGVLNLAQGAIAMISAYLLRQFAVVWDWPVPAAAVVTLLVVAPALGLLLDRWVFRPLALAGGPPGEGTARTLVASLGVFILLVGVATLVWGGGARTDVPELLPREPWAQLGCVAALALAVTAVTRWTRFGRELRAVVDNRQLAVLSGIDANRVAAVGWAFGAFTAGLTGVLLAPVVRLDPYGLPLLVIGVMGVAVAARLHSLSAAIVVALGVGVAQSQLTRLHPRGWAEPLLQAVGANLFVLTLLVAALALPGSGPGGGGPATATPPPAGRGPAWGRAGGREPAGPVTRPVGAGATALLVGCVLLLLPLGLSGTDLRLAVRVPAIAVVLLSLVLVSGRGGQISLGQAAYAGLGALFTALLAAGRFPGLPSLPELPALAVAVLLVAPLGLLTGGPAIRRHGLAPALVTLAFGMAVSRFVFDQPYATAGLGLDRPAGFTGDRAYYVLESVLLAGALLVTWGLRRGRPGRALAAMRDHEAGAAAAGVPVPGLKAGVFVVGAALAALGGGMLGMGLRAFDPATYDPVQSLLWFAVVVVLGADSPVAALAGAALLVGLDAGAQGGVAAALIGLLAVSLGRFPEGLAGALRGAVAGAGATEPVRPTPFGAQVRQRVAAPGGERRAGPVRHGATAVRSARPARGRRPGPAPAGRLTEGLTARGIRAGYQRFTVLDGVDIDIPPGRVTALIGPNGAGKTTLFDCLCGTLRPRAGRVALDGSDITRRLPHTRTRLGVARTFQQLAVFPSLSVADNVRVGAEQGQGRHPDPGALAYALRLTGLDGRVRDLPASGLPTGTLRRVELARALACRPRILLLDEPGAGLDAGETAALARLLRALAAEGTGLLIVEHDPGLVREVADTVHAMRAGRIVASGPAAHVLAEAAP